jgi:hypothetical protein
MININFYQKIEYYTYYIIIIYSYIMNIIECKYGSSCYTKNCKFKHPLNKSTTPLIKKDILCKFGSKCINTQCKFIHAKSNIYFKIYSFFALIISLYIFKGIHIKIFGFIIFILLFYIYQFALIALSFIKKIIK